MNISSRKKTALQVLGIIGVGAVTTVSMLYPDLAGNEQSIRSIQDKRESLETYNGQLQMNESSMQAESDRVVRMKEDIRPLKEEYDRLTTGIADTDLGLHIPSLLLSLENGAKDNDVTLEIEYDAIQTANGNETDAHDEGGVYDEEHMYDEENVHEELLGEPGEDPDYDEGMLGGEEETDLEQELIENHQGQSEHTDNSVDGQGGDELVALESGTPMDSDEEDVDILAEPAAAEDHPDVDLSSVQDNIPHVDGVSVTTVPLRVKGTYADVRSFILYIDDIDFIEHNLIDLYSYGENISGVIVLNVFHTENGGGLY